MTALAQIAADELDIDLSRIQMVRASTAASPNEGVTSGSLSSAAIRPRAAACLRRSPPDLPRTGGGSAGCRASMRSTIEDGTISGPRQCQDQLLGACRRSVARSRTPRPERNGEAASATCAGGTVRFSGSIFPTRYSRGRVSSTIGRCPDMLHGRVLRPQNARARLDRAEGGWRPRGSPVSSQSCAMAVLPASSAKPRMARKRPSRRCARARHGPRAKRCPTKTIWLRS